MVSNNTLIEYLSELRKEKYLNSHRDNNLILEIIIKLKEYNNIVSDIESLLEEIKEDIIEDVNICLSSCDEVYEVIEYMENYNDLDIKSYVKHYLIDKGAYNAKIVS